MRVSGDDMSLYGEYIKEREGFDIVENENGFATYKVTGDLCYIRDIYVSQASRSFAVATLMANKIEKIAKDLGCKRLMGTVDTNANGATDSLKVLLAYGFRVLRNEQSLIVFEKEV